MLEYFVLAWRNLWRNRNRTLITTASVFFAVVLVLFMRSMQLGTYAHIINNTVRLSTGYLQVQAQGFWEQQSIDHSFAPSAALQSTIDSLPRVTMTVPRLAGYALAAAGSRSRGVAVNGIDPAGEDHMGSLARFLARGAYLAPDSGRVLIGAALAELLAVDVGDSLALLGQGYHGLTAAGVYRIGGIVRLPLPELDSRTVFLPLPTAQQLFAAPDRLTALAVMLADPADLPSVKARLARALPPGLAVKDWCELMPELVQSIEFDNAGGLIMLGILYLVIAFGVFGTAMMMAAERRREFAVLVAVGMRRWKMAFVVFLETVIMGLGGAAGGALAAFPLLVYFHAHPFRLSGQAAQAMQQYGFEPIMAFRLTPDLFVRQAAVVAFIALVATLYPLWTIGRFKIANTLRA